MVNETRQRRKRRKGRGNFVILKMKTASLVGQWWFTEEEDGNAGEDNGPEKRCEGILRILVVETETK